ncbi:MAG: NAD(P)-binding protein [Alphaproteobacteria bacterium]|nr:NAD(P)-binding protein [Alphaproteobacteria bacterium]
MKKSFAITLDPGTSLANHTGSWRTSRPVYTNFLPPCNAACPAGEDIQGWLFHAEIGNYEKAWQSLVENNPIPAIMGRVCYHPCEDSCNRKFIDEPVSINSVERFIGDEALRNGWSFEKPKPSSGKSVLVIGSGPAGLSAAYQLVRAGHKVEIHEAGSMSGGMLRFGIPKYRLPREVLDAEIKRILDLGVTLKLNTKVTNIPEAMKAGKFDAVFMAVGAHVGKHIEIPDADANKVMDAVSVLRSMEGEEKPMLGKRVVVYGGGNTAIDVARSAKRMGATDSTIVYRRTRERMPATVSEVDEVLEEGIKIKWLSTIKHGGESEITVEKMKLDDKGFPQPTGELETLKADSVVLALGQDSDLSLLEGLSDIKIKDGMVEVGSDMMTGHSGVFAGGDMVPSDRTVAVAVGHGKKAARYIDGWLRGKAYILPPKHELASFEKINPWYYSDAPRTARPMIDMQHRQSTFDEVQGGLEETIALFEARRCLSCGNCFGCNNCYSVCPDNAVIKLGPGRRFKINLDYCKGCGLCVEECPCGAIKMVQEDI